MASQMLQATGTTDVIGITDVTCNNECVKLCHLLTIQTACPEDSMSTTLQISKYACIVVMMRSLT